MDPWLLGALAAGMLAVNLAIWKSRGRGWRRHVDALIAVLQPYVPEPVRDVLVLQPAGTVGRQARAEQGRGVNVLLGGVSGEVGGALAAHRADEAAAAETLPPMTALAVTDAGRYLLPVTLERGTWTAAPVERSWRAGDATYDVGQRALTVQVAITLADGTPVGAYEVARDPAGYAQALVARLASTG